MPTERKICIEGAKKKQRNVTVENQCRYSPRAAFEISPGALIIFCDDHHRRRNATRIS